MVSCHAGVSMTEYGHESCLASHPLYKCQAVIEPLQQFKGDPARYCPGTSIATVGVMFENRRQNLLNGVITKSASGKLQIDVYQALGNCPKYIQGKL